MGFNVHETDSGPAIASWSRTLHPQTGQTLSQHAQQVVEPTVDVERRGEVQQRGDFCARQVIVEAQAQEQVLAQPVAEGLRADQSTVSPT